MPSTLSLTGREGSARVVEQNMQLRIFALEVTGQTADFLL